MKKTITISGIEVSYDIDALVASAKNNSFDEDDFCDECDAGEGYKETQESFDAGIKSFIEDIKKLESEDVMISTFQNGTKITKKGELAKNNKQAIITGNVTMNYSNYYGSHSYDVPGIVAVTTGVKQAELMYTTVGQQSSF